MSYTKTLAALAAYGPERLGSGYYWDDRMCCALGAVAPATHPHLNDDIEQVWADRACRRELEALGLTFDEAAALQFVNDAPNQRRMETPEARYARVLAWLRAKVAAAGTAAR